MHAHSTTDVERLTSSQALDSLLQALQAEVTAYQPVFEKYNKQAKKGSFTHIAYYAVIEWNDQIRAEIESLTIAIRDYLNQRPELNSPEISNLRDKYNAIIDITKTLEKTLEQTETLDENSKPEVKVNVFSNENTTIAKQLDSLRKARLSQLKQFLDVCASSPSSVPNDEQSPFEGLSYAGTKNGGANFSGKFGGWYKDRDGNRFLVKQETHVEKVMGEYLAGTLLDVVYKYLEVAETDYAKIDLIRPRNADKNNKSGDDVYVKSQAIPDYQDDLWKCAWPTQPVEPSFWRGIWNAVWNITPTTPEMPPKRPPGLFNPKSLTWTDEYILQNNLQGEFAALAAPRLWLGDFGLHNGNFGIRKDMNNPHLAALDYGAAFYNFSDELTPYLPFNGFLFNGSLDFYKNHFRDYGPKVNASEAMAHVLIKIGTMKRDPIKQALSKGLDKIIELYNAEALEKFSKRLGMDPPAKSKKRIYDFILKNIATRQEALKKQGYALLLEHCVRSPNGNPHVNRDKLNECIKKHPDLRKFIKHEFKNYTLVYHRGLVGPAAWFVDRKIPIFSHVIMGIRHLIDNHIREAIHDAAKGIVKTSIFAKIRGFLLRNLEVAASVSYTWALAAFATSFFLPVAIPAMIAAFFVGALAGGVIAYAGCLIRDGIIALYEHRRETNTINSNPDSSSSDSSDLSSSGEIISAEARDFSPSPSHASDIKPAAPSNRQREDSLKVGVGFTLLGSPKNDNASSAPVESPQDLPRIIPLFSSTGTSSNS